MLFEYMAHRGQVNRPALLDRQRADQRTCAGDAGIEMLVHERAGDIALPPRHHISADQAIAKARISARHRHNIHDHQQAEQITEPQRIDKAVTRQAA